MSATDILSDVHGDLIDDYLELVEGNESVEANLRQAWNDATNADRTAQSFPEWLEEYAAQIAAAWVVTAVFVRFLEDNALIRKNYIAGADTDSRSGASDALRWFRTENPTSSETDYLLWVFGELAEMEAGGVFTERRNPLYRWELPANGGRKLLQRLRETDPDTGELELNFKADPRDTRFLGDLYEALAKSAGLKEKYGLVQTPDFVCDLILDYTLDEAVEELGADQVDMIDPACGSGHFLLDSFWRMFKALEAERPDWTKSRLVTEALDSIHGVDLNSFAVSIARFRLLAAGLQALSANGRPVRLDNAPDLPLNVGAGDSLLHGDFNPRFETDCTQNQAQKSLGAYLWRDEYSPEDAELLVGNPTDTLDNGGILSKRYEVVVGNPPYMTAPDSALNEAYREYYASCYYSYTLGCPFFERFFDLAKGPKLRDEVQSNAGKKSPSRFPGWIGMIQGNNFMKNRFGEKLVQDIIPNCDLTHVLDTSGAYIPQFGTPTVILIGRNRCPRTDSVRTVMGIKGEPSKPADPPQGKVWSSIVDNLEEGFFENDFVTINEIPRDLFHKHPWTLEGGGILAAKRTIETSANIELAEVISDQGFGAVTREDSIYITSQDLPSRLDFCQKKTMVSGRSIRNWSICKPEVAIWPYEENGLEAVAGENLQKLLWRDKPRLKVRSAYGKTQIEHGLKWYEYSMFFEKRYGGRTIGFAEIATHNHFIFDNGDKVFKRTAPIIKLPDEADDEEHFELLGPLNSSVGNFWARTMFQQKGTERSSPEPFLERYQRDGTKTKKFPIAENLDSLLPRRLDAIGRALAEHRPSVVSNDCVPTPEKLDAARKARRSAVRQMVPLQEELDWRMYQTYGLFNGTPLAEDYHPRTNDSEEVYADLPDVEFGERPFEIQLAREMAAENAETLWFERHDAIPRTNIPTRWPDWYRELTRDRIDSLRTERFIELIEAPGFKRRWNLDAWDKLEEEALEAWLARRLESPRYIPKSHMTTPGLEEEESEHHEANADPQLYPLRHFVDVARGDDAFRTVAKRYTGDENFDTERLVRRLIEENSVPYLPAQRYTDSGRRRREEWERAWRLQDREDAIDARTELDEGHDDYLSKKQADKLKGDEVGDIERPPTYRKTEDFKERTTADLRGKLDVPSERFVRYPGCADGDEWLVSWAGYDHAEHAKALAARYYEAKEDGWADHPEESRRLIEMLAGIKDLIFWVKKWHSDPEPKTGEPLGEYLESMVKSEKNALEFSGELDAIRLGK